MSQDVGKLRCRIAQVALYIDFASFYDFDILFWNCSDSVLFRTVPTVWHFLFFIIWLLLVLEMIEDKWIEECFLNLPGGATCGGCWYCWYSAVGHCCACWCWGHCCVGHCWVCCHCAACCCKSVNFFCSSVDIGFNSC